MEARVAARAIAGSTAPHSSAMIRTDKPPAMRANAPRRREARPLRAGAKLDSPRTRTRHPHLPLTTRPATNYALSTHSHTPPRILSLIHISEPTRLGMI